MSELTNTEQTIISEIRKQVINRHVPLLVVLDGRSGTGKSTLAQRVAKEVGGVVVIIDDFYSGGSDDKWQSYTQKAKVGEVVDWKRLRAEALEPLLAGKPASWYPLISS